jgi:hypothetical protein
MMKYHFKVHKEMSGFWAECLELNGCITQADTQKELYEPPRRKRRKFAANKFADAKWRGIL